MNKVEQDKLFFKEAKRQISELKKRNTEMYELLKECWDFIPVTVGPETKSAKLRRKIESQLYKNMKK